MPKFQAYFDDSGSHDGAPYLVVAGYLATPEAWEKFSGLWNKTIASWGLDHFHMKDAEAKQKQYSDWSDQQREERVLQLGALIAAHITQGIVVGVDAVVYKDVIEDVYRDLPEEKDWLESPYLLAFRHVLNGITDAANRHGIDKKDIQPFFADQGKIGDRAKRVARVVNFDGYPEPQFVTMKQTPPVQAADMLAWVHYRKFKENRTNEPLYPRHMPLGERGKFSVIERDTLEKFRAQIKRQTSGAVQPLN